NTLSSNTPASNTLDKDTQAQDSRDIQAQASTRSTSSNNTHHRFTPNNPLPLPACTSGAVAAGTETRKTY
ncbi:hypothetical protein FRC17_008653, partial [Serendipita sp. 399]